VINQILFLY